MPHPLQGLIFYRTVIIGLGSTGLQVLQSFQDLWYERFSNTSNSLVRLINIETDSNNRFTNTDEGSMIEQIFIDNCDMTFDQLADLVRNRINNPLINDVPEIEWDWNWTTQINWTGNIGVAGAAGAGGIRSGGRLLFYGYRGNESQASKIYKSLKTIKNDPDKWFVINRPNDEIKKEISESMGYSRNDWVTPDQETLDPVTNEFHSIVNPYFSNDVKVIVTGSLTGGTSSGTFIDMGYIVRKALNLSGNQMYKDLIGIFIIPPVNEEHLVGGGRDFYRIRANTFGSIYETQKVMKDYFNNRREAPYGVIYLIAPEYNLATPDAFISDVDGLCEIAALRIFTTTLGFHSKINSTLVNVFTNNPRNYMLTFGIGAVVYPKYSLAQALSYKLAEELCLRLTDEDKFYKTNEDRVELNSFINDIYNKAKDDVGELSKKIFNRLILDKENVLSENMQWIEKLANKTFRNENFHIEYTEERGFYYNNMHRNLVNIENEIFNEIKENIKERISNSINLYVVLQLIDDYLEVFRKTKKLLTRQECDQFSESLNNSVRIIERNFNKDKLKDNNIISSELWLLFEKFAMSYQINIINKLIDKIGSIRINISDSIDAVKRQKDEYDRAYSKFYENLNNRPEYAPVVKLFKIDKINDFNNIKKIFLGDRKNVGWSHLRPQIKQEFADKILEGNYQQSLKELLPELRRICLSSISKYLHPHEGEKFNLLDKVNEGGHVGTISDTFRKVKSGLLKFRNDIAENIPSNEYCHYLISNDSTIHLNHIIQNYGLNDNNAACSTYSNPLFEDMLIYIKDIPRINLEKLEKFSQLKEAFLHKPPDFRHLTDSEWTRLRLTLEGEVDYTIIEVKKTTNIGKVLEFIKYFWVIRKNSNGILFKKIKQPNYPTPQIFSGSTFNANGLYISENEKDLFISFTVAGPGHRITLKVNEPEFKVINSICQFDQNYNSFIEFYKEFTNFNTPNAGEYIHHLWENWQNNVMPLIQNDPNRNQIYDSTFLSEYMGEPNFGSATFSRNSESSLIGYLMLL